MTSIVLTATALAALDTLVNLPTRTQLGNIQVDTTLTAAYADVLEFTDHPVEVGAAITDHSFKRPMELLLRCGWSDSGPQAGPVGANQLFTGSGTSQNALVTGGGTVGSDYVTGVYSRLLALQESREPFSVETDLRFYDNMQFASIEVKRDQSTRYALRVEATLRQLILVSTQTATIPPQASQATPASTAETVPTGSQQATQGTPAPGGALPPPLWF